MSKVLSIRVTGAVQGIGYRPYIARLAEKLNLPMEDPAQRKAFVKNLIKTFAEL